jgi:hypothetical protein
LRFGLVQEGITWFADGPDGGGPSDDFLAVPVRGLPPGGGGDTSPGDDTGPGPDSGSGPGGGGDGGEDGGGAGDAGENPFADAGPPGGKVVLAPGCAAAPSRPGPALAAAALVALLFGRVRRVAYPRGKRLRPPRA